MAAPSVAPSLQDYPYLKSGRLLLLKQLWRKQGWRALYKQFWKNESREWSRRKIRTLAPRGVGLEIGVGEWSVAPVERTVLSDLFQSHAENASIARAFFPADQIPYAEGTFSFVLSEHVLEHVPDVWNTLVEWRRVLSAGGVLFLVLPHPDRTFDRHRHPTPITRFEALKGNPLALDDEIYAEWEELVLKKGLAPHYAKLTREEALMTNSLHRQVFVPETVKLLLEKLEFEILESHSIVPDRGDSFAVFARKR